MCIFFLLAKPYTIMGKVCPKIVLELDCGCHFSKIVVKLPQLNQKLCILFIDRFGWDCQNLKMLIPGSSHILSNEYIFLLGIGTKFPRTNSPGKPAEPLGIPIEHQCVK